MIRYEILYLELLKSALWGSPTEADSFVDLPPEIWEQIYSLASDQRTSAFISPAILALPHACQPPLSFLLKLSLHTEKVEAANRRLNDTLAHISEEYKSIDTPFILLKGQGVALNYSHPLHRTPGDLDLFFYRKGDYERAKKWVIEKGYPQEPESMKHLGFNIGKVHIENHRKMASFDSNRYNKYFQAEVSRLIDLDGWETALIGNTEVKLLPPTFNAGYLFIHLFHHFKHAGVSTRQLSDWLLLLFRYQDVIDKESLYRLFDELDLLQPASLFAAATVRYLGASPDLFPFPLSSDTQLIDKVMVDVLRGGNFGQHRPGKRRPSGVWSGRWHSFKRNLVRTITMASVAPSHILVMPFLKLYNRIKITMRGSV